MSAGACSAKMAEDRDKFFREAASLGIDFVPVVGDFKSFAEADDWIDYTLAAAGTLPFAKVFTKPLKEAKLLLKAGDLEGANKLIKDASDAIPTKSPSNPTSQSSSEAWKPSKGGDSLEKGSSGQVNSGLEWNSWQNYPKTIINDKQYAKIGDRLYSQHAVDRMQPSGLGSPAGTVGAGRNISPGVVEYTIQNGNKTTTIVNGVERAVYWSGEVGVVTENNASVIVTILRRSEK
ncbi:hypothetical protein AB9E53_07930 [Escherichia coli]|uniref:hypothetical protein n=1 Tax=Escherichia coli TaxID=562 RepID=UPI0012FF5E98|nr:hypothetical protein [Escherichia coli]EHP1983446.1 hypothetical protein [Escherichia coli]EKR5600756.1 hypothetical protein [Escherichia coli]EMA1269048.1 hypothetical protein [Escherichia coli]MED8971927.1 hypothetical protein [Escherichia coli]MXE36247.1 hypothetical protein [Escherichia coli]